MLALMQKPPGCPQKGLGCKAVGQATAHAHLDDGVSQGQASKKAHPKPPSLLLWPAWTSPRASGIFSHGLQASSRICRSSASPFLAWLARPLTTGLGWTKSRGSERASGHGHQKCAVTTRATSTRPAPRMWAWRQREQPHSAARLERVVWQPRARRPQRFMQAWMLASTRGASALAALMRLSTVESTAWPAPRKEGLLCRHFAQRILNI